MRLPLLRREGRGFLGGERGEGSISPRDQVELLLPSEPQNPAGRMVDQGIRRLEVELKAARKLRPDHAVDARQQLDGRVCANRLLEQSVQRLVGDVVEAGRGLSHLGHALA